MHDEQTPPWQIKVVDWHDAADITALRKLIWASAREAGLSRLDTEACVRALQSHPSVFALLLCSRERKPLAMCLNYLGFFAFAARPTIRVHELFVLPEYRRCGLARALLAAVESSARSIGAASLQLERRFGALAEIDEIVARLGFAASWEKSLEADLFVLRAAAKRKQAAVAATDNLNLPEPSSMVEPNAPMHGDILPEPAILVAESVAHLEQTASFDDQACVAKPKRRRATKSVEKQAKDTPSVESGDVSSFSGGQNLENIAANGAEDSKNANSPHFHQVIAGVAFEDFSEQIQTLAQIVDPVIPTKAKPRRTFYVRRRRQSKNEASEASKE